MVMNSSVSASTGSSPNFLVFWCEIALPSDHALHHTAPNVAAEDMVHRATHGVDVARAQLAPTAAYMARYANRSRCNVQFGVGEHVLLSTRNLQTVGS